MNHHGGRNLKFTFRIYDIGFLQKVFMLIVIDWLAD